MESFRECGWPAFAALGAGTLALLVGVVALALALIKPRIGLILGIVALAMSFGPGGVGFAGMLYGRQQVDDIVTSGIISADKAEELRAVGYHEAGQCVSVGATIGVLPLLMAAIAIAVGAVGKTKENPA